METKSDGGRGAPEWVPGEPGQSAAFEEAVEWAGFALRAAEAKSMWAGNAAIFAACAGWGASQAQAPWLVGLCACCAALSSSRMAWKALEQGAAGRLMERALGSVGAPVSELVGGVARIEEGGRRRGAALAALAAFGDLRSGARARRRIP